jgi:CubicO group peptidase (beta-lactamase class C family)
MLRTFLAATMALTIGTATADARDQTPLGRVAGGLAGMSRAGRFSGVVLVARGGRPVLERAYGLANRDTRESNRLTTQFNLASLGKVFTGVAVAQLVGEGKVRFGDRVGRYVPELPPRIGRSITVAELLDHTSGLGDYFADPGYERLRPRLTSLRAYLPLIAQERLAVKPGTRFSYSNSGFVLAGLVVERASGESFYRYLRQHVWGPAGMTRTGCFPPTPIARGRAVGYTAGGVANTAGLPPRGTSAGGCYSTAPDLLRFANALVRHRLLSPALTRTVTSTHVAAPGGGYAYGFGVRTGPPATIWHNGGSPGVATELDVNPRLGYTVAILENRDPDQLRPAVDLVLNALRIP